MNKQIESIFKTSININKKIANDINTYFSDLPKHNIDFQISKIGIFNSVNGNENFRNNMMKNFIERIEEGQDHEGTIFGILRLIKDGLNRDILDGYKSYLYLSFSKYLENFNKYIDDKINSKDPIYSLDALNSLSLYKALIDERVHNIIQEEMKKVENFLGKETKTAETKTTFWSKITNLLNF